MTKEVVRCEVYCHLNIHPELWKEIEVDLHPAFVVREGVTVLEAKREEFVDDALIYAKSLREELEISFEPPRRIRRKHIFGDGSKDVQLSYADDSRRTMFSSIDRVTADIQERFQQLQNLTQKCAFLRSEVILSMDELNLDQAPQDIKKELQLDCVGFRRCNRHRL
ncbi:uncharacterized protein TNCV_3775781 [Trichonephila clavipes]|nr:uncharacterized protein TNCV_3775781 [Trichonephila clavipes]